MINLKVYLNRDVLLPIACGAVLGVVLLLGGRVTDAVIKSLKPLSPEILAEWEIRKVLVPQRIITFIVDNPDKASPVRAVALRIKAENMALLGYKYFEGKLPRKFDYNQETETFDEVKLTTRQKKQCFACHRDGEYSKEVSSGDVGREAKQR